MDANDTLAIQDVINLYGHILDDRRWLALAEVFASNARLDMTAFGVPVLTGLDAIQAAFSSTDRHPDAHLATNILVISAGDGAEVVSKGLLVMADGTARSIVYRDRLDRKAEGWRIGERTALPRTTAV
jgi:hypothetical protein